MEKWKNIKDLKGYYQISEDGRVRSVDRDIPNHWGSMSHFKGKERVPSIDKCGYKMVSLKKQGVMRGMLIHRLVAEAFIPNPENKPCINHINGDKLDNRVENLEWCTHAENIRHSYNTGLKKKQKGELNPSAKLTDSDIRCIRLSNAPVTELSEIYGVSIGVIYNIKARRTWRHIQ